MTYILKQLRLLTSVSLLCLIQSNIFGWGANGHETVNFEALWKIKDTNAGKCLMQNNMTVEVGGQTVRGGAFVLLGTGPDEFWKTVGTAPSDPKLRHLRGVASTTEHTYHFFEGDAFAQDNDSGIPILGSIAQLPSSVHYMRVRPADPVGDMPDYLDLLKSHANLVSLIDPSKTPNDPPTPRNVADHGTAPWRAYQMYREAVSALKRRDVPVALVYLGAMGHYVGDMSQPFHASLNYDGQYPNNIAYGIHGAFETDMLDQYAQEEGNATHDVKNNIWSNYNATHEGVSRSAGSDMGDQITRHEQIIPEILKLVDTGFPYGPELIKAFAPLLEKHENPRPSEKPVFTKTRATQDRPRWESRPWKLLPTPKFNCSITQARLSPDNRLA